MHVHVVSKKKGSSTGQEGVIKNKHFATNRMKIITYLTCHYIRITFLLSPVWDFHPSDGKLKIL